jgi:hypothetical protein
LLDFKVFLFQKSLPEEKNTQNEMKKLSQTLEKFAMETEEKKEKLASLFSVSTKKSGEDLLGDIAPKKMSGSMLSFDESMPKNSSFQNIFQNTPYKSNFKPRNSPLIKTSEAPMEDELKMELEESEENNKRNLEKRKIMKIKKILKKVDLFSKNIVN